MASMVVKVNSKIRQALSQALRDMSLAEGTMLLRLRRASIGMVGLVAAVGLGLIVFISQLGWPGVPGSPIPSGGPQTAALGKAIALAPPVFPARGAIARPVSAPPVHVAQAAAHGGRRASSAHGGSGLGAGRSVSGAGQAPEHPVAPAPVPAPAPAPARAPEPVSVPAPSEPSPASTPPAAPTATKASTGGSGKSEGSKGSSAKFASDGLGATKGKGKGNGKGSGSFHAKTSNEGEHKGGSAAGSGPPKSSHLPPGKSHVPEGPPPAKVPPPPPPPPAAEKETGKPPVPPGKDVGYPGKSDRGRG